MPVKDFTTLIHPTDRSVFFSSYWEQQPLIVARNAPSYYLDLLAMDDIDTMLTFVRPHPPDIRVIQNQQDLLPDKYLNADGSLNLNQLYKAYSEGYTIVLNELQRFWQPLAVLCRTLQQHLHHLVVANMYLSPARSKGLLPHFDTHDVFVLQIAGSKRWSIYETLQPTPLLHSFQPVIARDHLPPCLHEVEVKAGDLLYIPRGFVHEADAEDDSSLHLTLGIYPTQWHDLLSHALTALSLREERLRHALPIGFLDRTAQRAALQERFQLLAALFAKEALLDEAMLLLEDQVIRQAPPLPDGHFRQLDALDSVAGTTPVSKRSGLWCRVLTQGESASIQFSGNTITGRRPFLPALQFIAASQGPFTAYDLPGYVTDEGKVTLVRRLIRGGLLRRV